MTAAPRIERYRWAGGNEAMLRFGPVDGPAVVVAMPLFEEANRTRALTVAVLRRLGDDGIAGVLPDLPGQGESIAGLADLRLTDWRDAFAAAVATSGPRAAVVSFRGGALVDTSAKAMGRFHVAPIAGATVMRALLRARRAAALAVRATPPDDNIDTDGPPLLLAGNLMPRALARDLMMAVPVAADRTSTLWSDVAPGDRAPAAPRYHAPWTASEPFVDLDLATALADEIAQWMRACVAC